LGHILLAWAMVSPRVMPVDVLPILVLLPLAWTRAGWVLERFQQRCSVSAVPKEAQAILRCHTIEGLSHRGDQCFEGTSGLSAHQRLDLAPHVFVGVEVR
jgi:hypothetical protein